MVYLLHFDRPLAHAKHYLGFTPNSVASRLGKHRANGGSALTRHLNSLGIGYQVSRVWVGGRKLERKLKNRKNAPKLCPMC